jgi:hypothetical protein
VGENTHDNEYTLLFFNFKIFKKVPTWSIAQIEMSCPCGLTQAQLDKHNLVGDGGVCTAFKKGSRTERCGELLADHPDAGKISIIR